MIKQFIEKQKIKNKLSKSEERVARLIQIMDRYLFAGDSMYLAAQIEIFKENCNQADLKKELAELCR